MNDLLITCNKLRGLGYKPYFPVVVIEEHGKELLEAISFPFPEKGNIYILARKVGQPETMRKYLIPDYAMDHI